MNKQTVANDKDQKTESISEKVSNSNTTTKKLPDILGGVIFITIGTILLLNNFGIIPWIIWLHLAGFWPVIFVFIGLDLLSGDSPGLKILTTVTGLLIFAFILSYSLSTVDPTFKNYLNNQCKFCQKIFDVIQIKIGTNSGRLFYTNEGSVNMQNPIFRD